MKWDWAKEPEPNQHMPVYEYVSVSASSSVAEEPDHFSSLFPREVLPLLLLLVHPEGRDGDPEDSTSAAGPQLGAMQDGGLGQDTNSSVGHIVQ